MEAIIWDIFLLNTLLEEIRNVINLSGVKYYIPSICDNIVKAKIVLLTNSDSKFESSNCNKCYSNQNILSNYSIIAKIFSIFENQIVIDKVVKTIFLGIIEDVKLFQDQSF